MGLLEDDLEESFEEAIGAPKLDDEFRNGWELQKKSQLAEDESVNLRIILLMAEILHQLRLVVYPII